MKVYIADLSAYNAGHMIGNWIDVTSEHELHEAIAGLLIAGATAEGDGEHEEWFVSDYDETPDWVANDLGEYPSVAKLVEVAKVLDNVHDEYALEAWANYTGYGVDEIDHFDENSVHGPKPSMEDVAYAYVEDGLLGEIPDSVAGYIDYRALGRDLYADGYWVETSNGYYEINE